MTQTNRIPKETTMKRLNGILSYLVNDALDGLLLPWGGVMVGLVVALVGVVCWV